MRIILQRTLEEHEDVEAGEAAEAAAVHRDQKQPFRKVISDGAMVMLMQFRKVRLCWWFCLVKIKSQRIGDMVMVKELESAVHRDQKQPCLVKIKSNGDIG